VHTVCNDLGVFISSKIKYFRLPIQRSTAFQAHTWIHHRSKKVCLRRFFDPKASLTATTVVLLEQLSWLLGTPSGAAGSRDTRFYPIPPAVWPPNSPDLNPVDYIVWIVLQEWVYRTTISDVDELKRRINSEWTALSHAVIERAVGEWRPRLRTCIRAGGGHFEHM